VREVLKSSPPRTPRKKSVETNDEVPHRPAHIEGKILGGGRKFKRSLDYDIVTGTRGKADEGKRGHAQT